MLTQDTLELIVTAVVYIVLGMFLGNLILITLGLVPIIFLSGKSRERHQSKRR